MYFDGFRPPLLLAALAIAMAGVAGSCTMDFGEFSYAPDAGSTATAGAGGATTGTPGGAGGSGGSGASGGTDSCGSDPTSTTSCSDAACTGGCTNGTCTVLCDDQDECRGNGVTINCPSGVACEVICSGRGSCEDATINCPDDFSCTVSCTEDNACNGTTINCSAWGGCQVTCGTHNHSCEHTELNCGNDRCEILCTDVDQGGNPPEFGPSTCPNQCDNCTSSGQDC